MAAPVSSCYEKYLFWKVAVQNNCSERELLRITGIQEPTVKTCEECLWIIGWVAHHKIHRKTFFSSFFGTGDFLWILQNFQEHLFWRVSVNDCFWLQAGELNRRDLPLLPCLVYINISEGSSFFFFYRRFLYTYLFWFLKLNLQTEKLYGGLRSFLKHNLKERDCIFKLPQQIW